MCCCFKVYSVSRFVLLLDSILCYFRLIFPCYRWIKRYLIVFNDWRDGRFSLKEVLQIIGIDNIKKLSFGNILEVWNLRTLHLSQTLFCGVTSMLLIIQRSRGVTTNVPVHFNLWWLRFSPTFPYSIPCYLLVITLVFIWKILNVET